jgi:hypothetical protein
VFDSFPFDEWSEEITAFWTYGPENSTGTYIMTVLGVLAMVIALVWFFVLEKKKLESQAAFLRSTGALDPPTSPTPRP